MNSKDYDDAELFWRDLEGDLRDQRHRAMDEETKRQYAEELEAIKGRSNATR